jgi:hypothetical protein
VSTDTPDSPPAAIPSIDALKGRVVVFYAAGRVYEECARRLNEAFADPAACAELLAGARLLAERAEAFERFMAALRRSVGIDA